jgi:hypothetical protein
VLKQPKPAAKKTKKPGVTQAGSGNPGDVTNTPQGLF